ncbi:MCE family protein [Mycobacterium sp. 3519A]|uniref:MCE family protein n=1 Tax=Mycobacterium sp. 3519A TaxID=2057184 RepID=UPI001F2460E0|nr:MCE family protein [Mycobacterium sp. 3519A]
MRIAAAGLVGLIAIVVVFTYLSYNAVFSSFDIVTVMSPRAGLVMDKDAKVKYRGIRIGRVTSIDYSGDDARLTLAIDSRQLGHIPSNAKVRIASTTVFGAKAVEFLIPDRASGHALSPGTVVEVSNVQLEANTLFETLTDLLHKIDPIELNGTLSAIAEGLRGNGDNLGAGLSSLNNYLAQINPKMPMVQADLQKTAQVANIYADAAPDLVTILDNVPSISATVVEEQDNLNAALLSATGLANNGFDTLAPGADDLVAGVQRLRAPLQVLGEYSPEIPCLLRAIPQAIAKFAPIIGGIKPGLYTSSSFLPGVPAYTYPESLPIVNAHGGPNCRGLPNIPNRQYGGSWYHAPFVVTDNAYVPFQPNTELQFNAPSTLQFLFHGAFAERDDF